MIETTFNSQDVFLLNDYPNWQRGFKTDFDIYTDAQESLTNRETRRPYAATVRATINASCVVTGANLRLLQKSLRGLKAQPVLFPFWPVVAFWSARASAKITGGLMIAFKSDWSQYEIYEAGSEPGWPAASDIVCPLLWGFIEKTELRFINRDSSIFPIIFRESSISNYALSFAAISMVDGLTPAGYSSAPPMLPFRADYMDDIDSFVVPVTNIESGFTRSSARTFYPQDVKRTQQSRYTIVGSTNVAGLISWFQNYSGQGSTFWSPGAFSVGVLQSASLAGDTALTWTDSNVIAGDGICAFLDDGAVVKAKVSSVVGTTINLSAPFGSAMKAGQVFYSLSLARLDKPKISIEWLSPVIAQLKIAWVEVRPEQSIPAGETLSVTLGQLPERIVLFDFWRDFGDGTVTHWRFTSNENDIAFNGYTWTSGNFDLGDISFSVNLEEDACEVKSTLVLADGSAFTGNPLFDEIAMSSDVPLHLGIYFASYMVEPPVPGLQGVEGEDIFGVTGDKIAGTNG